MTELHPLIKELMGEQSGVHARMDQLQAELASTEQIILLLGLSVIGLVGMVTWMVWHAQTSQ